MRRTHSLIAVALALLDDPSSRHWGYSLSKASGVRSGVMYPILTRMLEEGWLSDGWEDQAETGGKRPPRRYYQVTDKGCAALGGLIREAASDARFRGLVGAPRFAC